MSNLIRPLDQRLKEFSNQQTALLNKTVRFKIDLSVIQLFKGLGMLVVEHELPLFDKEIITSHTPISIAQDTDKRQIILLTTRELLFYNEDGLKISSIRISPTHDINSDSNNIIPGGLAVCKTRIYLSYHRLDTVQVYKSNGAFIYNFGKTGDGMVNLNGQNLWL